MNKNEIHKIHETVNALKTIPVLIPLGISDGIEIDFIEHLQNTLMSFIELFEAGVVDETEKNVYTATMYLSKCLIDASVDNDVLQAQNDYKKLLDKQNSSGYEEELKEQHLLVYKKFINTFHSISAEREIITLAQGA